MFNNFIKRAGTVLVAIHAVLWSLVMIVWIRAWKVEPQPAGPAFNFAKRFISRIDIVVSYPLDTISLSIAKLLGANLGLTFTVVFAVLVLIAGSLQWVLIARVLQRVAVKYGTTEAATLSACLVCWVCLALISWLAPW